MEKHRIRMCDCDNFLIFPKRGNRKKNTKYEELEKDRFKCEHIALFTCNEQK